MIPVPNSAPKNVFSFARTKGDDKVFVVLNFSKQSQTVTFNETIQLDSYQEYFTKQDKTFTDKTQTTSPSFGYQVFVKTK
jgi:hypothetical protein